MTQNPISLATSFVLLGALASGCVTMKKYEALESRYANELEKRRDLEAVRSGLADELSDSQQEVRSANAYSDALEADNAEMQRALAALRRNQADSESRVQAYRDLVGRFADMIDAGTLKVAVVEGRLVVQLPTDILFPSGSAELSADGREQLARVGQVLATMERDFQVEGHTDSDPISTERFPSNWELSAARAITVVRVLGENGVVDTRLSAAGFADTHPVASNDAAVGKAENRRIEVVLRPDLSLMPGFDALEALADGTASVD